MKNEDQNRFDCLTQAVADRGGAPGLVARAQEYHDFVMGTVRAKPGGTTSIDDPEEWMEGVRIEAATRAVQKCMADGTGAVLVNFHEFVARAVLDVADSYKTVAGRASGGTTDSTG